MAKLGNYGINNSEKIECPISKENFLENIKGKLGKWNTEEGKNIFHSLDNFIVLNIGYTIKGQVWDDNLKKYTSRYFSNEVQSFNETFYAIETTFDSNKKAHKRLKAKGLWNNYNDPKQSVKGKMPQGVGLKVGVTILDLDDGIIKEFFMGISDFINNVQEQLKNSSPETIWGYKIRSMYTNGTKVDGKDVFITEDEVNKLPGLKAADYKKRYISTIENKGVGTEEQIKHSEDVLDKLISYMNANKEYYKKEYGDGDSVVGLEQKKYAPEPKGIQNDEDFEKEVKEEQVVEKKFEATQEQKVQAKNKIEEQNNLDIGDVPF